MFVQDGFLYLIVTKHKLTVYFSRKRVCPHSRNQRGRGTHWPEGEGVGGPQFGRLEKKPSTLSTLCQRPLQPQ